MKETFHETDSLVKWIACLDHTAWLIVLDRFTTSAYAV